MELTPDIQTGRNVYADKDLYESDDTYKAKIDSYVNEGFKLVYGSPDEPSEGGGGSGGGSVLIINAVASGEYGATRTLDKTWKEIKDAITSGTIAYIKSPDDGYDLDSYNIVEGCRVTNGTYDIYANIGNSRQGSYHTDSEDGYPWYNFG